MPRLFKVRGNLNCCFPFFAPFYYSSCTTINSYCWRNENLYDISRPLWKGATKKLKYTKFNLGLFYAWKKSEELHSHKHWAVDLMCRKVNVWDFSSKFKGFSLLQKTFLYLENKVCQALSRDFPIFCYLNITRLLHKTKDIGHLLM